MLFCKNPSLDLQNHQKWLIFAPQLRWVRFWRYGYRSTSIFPGEFRKLILPSFNLPKRVFLALKVVVCSVFHQIFSIPPIAKICMKNASKSIFCKNSKTSENFAFCQKKLGEYPKTPSRCYKRRKRRSKSITQRKF